MSQTILETAYEMRGMERLFTDFFERPEYVRVLFERIAERRCFQARRMAEAGVDVLRIGDDIATQSGLLVGPPMYREWIKPLHARVVAAARAVKPDIPVLYHSDGTLTALLPDLIEAGVTAINPVQAECMPHAQTKAEFGDRLVLWGCCSTQSVYAHGTEEDVVAEVRSLMQDVAPGGGLIVQFYNMLVTDRVLRNLECFFRTFRNLARYA
jgi:uroporphyrinogen decarboxylase